MSVHYTCLCYLLWQESFLEAQNGSFSLLEKHNPRKYKLYSFRTNSAGFLLGFFLSSQARLSKTGDDKDVPFNSWAGTRSSQSHIGKWRLL